MYRTMTWSTLQNFFYQLYRLLPVRQKGQMQIGAGPQNCTWVRKVGKTSVLDHNLMNPDPDPGFADPDPIRSQIKNWLFLTETENNLLRKNSCH